MKLEKKIKQLRHKNELTQAEMAIKIGVSQPYYSALESGKKPVSKAILRKIITAFDLPDVYFINSRGDNSSDEVDTNLIKTKNKYLNRIVNNVEFEKDEDWHNANKSASTSLAKVNYFYQRIVDVKILLSNVANIRIKGGTYAAYEADIMHKVFNDNNSGILRLNYSDKDELLEFNEELTILIKKFEERFFELFRILYKYLRTDIELSEKLPDEID